MPLDAFKGVAMSNVAICEELYASYLANPASVDSSWRTFFDELERESIDLPAGSLAVRPAASQPIAAAADWRILSLIQAYRTYGHLAAEINPIATHAAVEPLQLKLSAHGLAQTDLEQSFYSFGLCGGSAASKVATLGQIIAKLKGIYCAKMGVEYIGICSPALGKWLQVKLENDSSSRQLSIEQKQLILKYLNKSELFEMFLHTKYVGQKRFSLEGGETLIPILAALIELGSQLGVAEFVLGMAHRGRLNVLANILNKSYADVFSEFEEGYIPDSFEGSGDVKYHKGFSSEITTLQGKRVRIAVAPNPSHLESVYPVVEGQVRARQIMRGDIAGREVAPFIVHGDASIAGQGVVYEALQMHRLEGYSTGGTVHVVINNQIGFTSLPVESRSTLYCTAIASTFGAPVFHVNAEDPEGCVYAAHLAMQIRQQFHCDVFIDINCYRKYGHNETDEPAYTQPLEYQIIRKKRPIRELYRDDLICQGVVEKSIAEALEVDFKAALQAAMQNVKSSQSSASSADKQSSGDGVAMQPASPGIVSEASSQAAARIFQPVETGVHVQELQTLAHLTCSVPEGFSIHPKLHKVLEERLEMVNAAPEARKVDWGMSELLAYSSLVSQGIHVRISGQDCCRGTFSHRHAVWVDQLKAQNYCPLANLQGQGKRPLGRFDIYNSLLSEYAVLAFEFGYSTASPESLVIWEAQFGDFANGAQVVIDQYIASAEQKWGRKSALVLLLPHAYEGQGPEHSSGRMERFLALAGNNNMWIANPSTPAQLFHLLRRQCLHTLRKPLIVFTPKGLLRHPACVNAIADFTKGSFQEVLDDPFAPKKPKRLVLCSGHIYYELLAMRSQLKVEDVAFVRIEQLYPLHLEKIKALFDKYKGFKDLYWVQEEPSNMGAWDFIMPALREILPKSVELKYIGRKRSASPAVGSYALHKKEHAEIIQALFEK